MEQNQSTKTGMVRVSDYLQILRPNAAVYRGMPSTYRDGIQSLYGYFKDMRNIPVFPQPFLVLEKPKNAIGWYREAAKLQRYMIWNKFIEDAIYAKGEFSL